MKATALLALAAALLTGSCARSDRTVLRVWAMGSEGTAIGTLFLLPTILMYTAWSYWVFRGKIRGDTGYH